MKKAAIAMLIASVVGISACQKQADPLKVETLTLETDTQKQSYALGASVGNFMQQKLAAHEELNLEVDNTLVVKGFIAGLQQQSQFDNTEIQTLTNALDKQVRDAQQAAAEKIGAENLAAGKAYLDNNAKREEVTVTDSGLQYEVLTPGDGPQPTAEDTVKVHYKGTLLDGTEFDSSYSRGEPAVFPLHRVIAGWTEGVQLMNVGAKYKFHIPSDLAYGARSTGKITSNSTLIFEVELMEIVGAETVAEE